MPLASKQGGVDTSCHGKIRYDTPRHAYAAIKKTGKTGKSSKNTRPGPNLVKGRKTLHAYKCRFCSMWHIGNDTRINLHD